MQSYKPALVFALAAFVLSGCTSAPSSVPTTAPPTADAPAPDTVVAALVISGSGVSTANANGAPIKTQPYSAGSSAMVSFLTDALGGAPKTAAVANPECLKPSSLDYWGERNQGLEVRIPKTPTPPLFDWVVVARGAVIGDVAIRSSEGFAIGDDTKSIVAGLPESQKVGLHDPVPESSGNTSRFVFDLTKSLTVDGKTVAYGAAALSDGDSAAVIVAPADANRFGC
ncbi:MAG: hypothetical protein QOF79_2173 [Actinomycetota bacterium]|nr:hypothetical protein [Actinomycetota bacterium]